MPHCLAIWVKKAREECLWRKHDLNIEASYCLWNKEECFYVDKGIEIFVGCQIYGTSSYPSILCEKGNGTGSEEKMKALPLYAQHCVALQRIRDYEIKQPARSISS